MEQTQPRLALAGCANNLASLHQLDDLAARLEPWASAPAVLLYESFSTDGTRQRLLAWARRRPRLRRVYPTPREERLQPADEYGSATLVWGGRVIKEPRVARIAACRRSLLAHARRRAALTHLLQLDLDCNHTVVQPDALRGAVAAMEAATPRFAMLSANTLPAYYDLWALRSAALGVAHDCHAVAAADPSHCYSYRLSIDSAAPPLPVGSAFNGLALYRMAALRRAANCTYTDTTTCEHVGFHRCLATRYGLRLGIAPGLVVGCGAAHDKPLRAQTRYVRVDARGQASSVWAAAPPPPVAVQLRVRRFSRLKALAGT